MNYSLRLSLALAGCFAALTHFNPLAAQTSVGDAATLQADINAGQTNFVLTGNITGLTTPIFIGTATSPTITINGGGFSITGNSEIFFVQSGNVTLSNMTLSGNAVGGNGGAANSSGGGALGAGGAIFIGSSATVTASSVQFLNNSATGGSSASGIFGYGGGGGMNGGNGGTSPGGPAGSGGGGGNAGNGGNGAVGGPGGGGGGLLAGGGNATSGPSPTGGAGGSLIGTGGAGGVNPSNGGNGGINGGGGGGAASGGPGTNGGNGGTNGGGGGGGRDASLAGNGGSYGGGGGFLGGPMLHGGNGGFGGGGGGSANTGGAGGFGAGGGGSTANGGTTGAGGVGGGSAIHGTGPGGGGAGLGGAVFAQAGGEFIITGNQTYSGNSVTGGTGANNGAAVGSSLFVMTGAGVVIAPGTGNRITINGTIADDSASSLAAGHSYTPGTASGVGIQFGSSTSVSGTVTLNGANTFSGGGTITNATVVEAGNARALGTGPITNQTGVLQTTIGNHTIVLNGYTQNAQGALSLFVNGTNGGATADLLHVTNTTSSQTTLGGSLVINFSGFTATASGAAHTLDFTVVQTDAGFTGTFSALDSLGLNGATASLQYAGNNVNLLLALPGSVFSFAGLGLSSNERGVLSSINTGILSGGSSPSLNTLTTAFGSLPTTNVAGALDQLTQTKFNQFASSTAFNNASFDVADMDSYLDGERTGPNGTFARGNGQVDTRNFVVQDANIDPGLQMVHSRMLAWNDVPGTITDIPSAVLGGIDMKEVKPQCSACTAGTPWNVFLRGSVILAQDFSQPEVPHSDNNTSSVTAGADYRLSEHLLVGATMSYAHTDATLDNFGSSATVDSYSPGVYASYADGGWFANFIGRYSYNTYTDNRRIAFLGQTANGATNGNEGLLDLDGGYLFHSGSWSYGPVAGLQYTHLTLNGYSEQDSDANLSVNEDQSDSLRSRLGGEVRYSTSGCGMSFSPHLTATWQHEFMDQSRGLTSSFTQFSGGSFTVRTDDPSRDSALIDLGLDAKVNDSITVFGDYIVQAGQENYFGQSLQAGVRIGF